MNLTQEQAAELLKQLGASDDFIEQANAQNKAQLDAFNEKQIEEAADYFAAFTSVSGSVVLEKLKDLTTRLPVMEKRVGDIAINLNPGEFMAYREGQNSIIRHITDMIILATQKDGE